MPRVNLDPGLSALVIVDVQASLIPHICERERVVDRIAFLAKIARLLEIPIFVTEQNPTRMGGTVEPLQAFAESPIPKMSFGATGSPEFMDEVRRSGRNQWIVTGVETHICVGLTAQGLLEAGYEVVVCPDAVSSRTMERHKLGMERIRDAGIVPAHTESVAYEWLGSAEHLLFRQALAVVKEHP